ncbi:DNA methyltransferase [Nostoc sphaeroides]|nr:DNA methyltransferase [Nostoc sphaeroides]
MGSGTTCVVATELNREYIGIEIKPDYYELAIAEVNAVNKSATQLKLL